MRILVCGGREYNDYNKICIILNAYIHMELYPLIHKHEIVIMQGMCRGADLLAKRYATDSGITCEDYPADWSLGKKAGILRNIQMLEMKPDIVFAFHSNINESKGTKHMIAISKTADVEVRIHT